MWQRAGISHLLSVSGLHIGLVSSLVRRLAAKLGGGGSLTSWVGIGAGWGWQPWRDGPCRHCGHV